MFGEGVVEGCQGWEGGCGTAADEDGGVGGFDG